MALFTAKNSRKYVLHWNDDAIVLDAMQRSVFRTLQRHGKISHAYIFFRGIHQRERNLCCERPGELKITTRVRFRTVRSHVHERNASWRGALQLSHRIGSGGRAAQGSYCREADTHGSVHVFVELDLYQKEAVQLDF